MEYNFDENLNKKLIGLHLIQTQECGVPQQTNILLENILKVKN